MLNRKQELKKWFIDHSDVTPAMLAEDYGKTTTVAYGYLYHHPSAPKEFLDVCDRRGVPSKLLPPPTRTKGELLKEVEMLRCENAALKESCGGSLCPEQSSA